MPSRTGVPPVFAARTVNCPYVYAEVNLSYMILGDYLVR
jgi:hypothetical protein